MILQFAYQIALAHMSISTVVNEVDLEPTVTSCRFENDDEVARRMNFRFSNRKTPRTFFPSIHGSVTRVIRSYRIAPVQITSGGRSGDGICVLISELIMR